MPKRKLSETQRGAIRKDIGNLLKAGKSIAETLRTVAKQFGVTTVTARWYLKSLKSSPTIASSKAQSKKAKRARGRLAVRSAAYRNGSATKQGGAYRLVAGLKAVAEDALSRARQAKKLIPQWHLYLSQELSLRKMEKKIGKELKVAARKAHALGLRIKELTSR